MTNQTPTPAPTAGATRVVVMNGSRIVMKFDGRQWWNIKVTPAAPASR